jgi:serine/threonine protein kinase
VYALASDPGQVAKIFHKPSVERATKLKAMIVMPPDDPTRSQGHVSIAWPTELIYNGAALPVGFSMPRVDERRAVPLSVVYNPGARRDKTPGFTWRYLVRTARNLAAAVSSLHQRGYVVGDLNESNAMVNQATQITLLDCDSMQVARPDGGYYRCLVGKAEYTPPELAGQDFAQVDRTTAADDFALAVLIFQLLMEGVHPFQGVWKGQGDPPGPEALIKLGHFPYSGLQLCAPPPFALPFSVLPEVIRAALLRCFVDGQQYPNRRPTARAWTTILAESEAGLQECTRNSAHWYASHVTSCPWCERVQRGLDDPFSHQPSGGASYAGTGTSPGAGGSGQGGSTSPAPAGGGFRQLWQWLVKQVGGKPTTPVAPFGTAAPQPTNTRPIPRPYRSPHRSQGPTAPSTQGPSVAPRPYQSKGPGTRRTRVNTSVPVRPVAIPQPGNAVGSGPEVVANTFTFKYHLPSCEWAQKISRSNAHRMRADQARQLGMIPCRVCRPR